MRFMQLSLFGLLLFISNFSFSQVGTYELGVFPPEAYKLLIDENGQGVIPPLIVGEVLIKLKSNKNARIIHNKNEADELIEVGTWAQSEKEGFILISIVDGSVTITVEYQIISYESGTYLKGPNRFEYYKKKG